MATASCLSRVVLLLVVMSAVGIASARKQRVPERNLEQYRNSYTASRDCMFKNCTITIALAPTLTCLS
jgi:hypothetical protein